MTLLTESVYTGEQQLLLAVIESAVHDQDMEYFNGRIFEQHCYYLGITTVQGMDTIRARCMRQMREV